MMIGIFGTALGLRSRAARPRLSIFVVWTIVTFAGYFVSSPVGHNFLRPSAVVFPLMLLTAKLADYRPRWLAIPALVAAFSVNIFPYATTLIARSDPAAQASFWSAAARLHSDRHSSPSFRLEVVPTINHWEAYYVPKAGFAIARGWYQQLDVSDNAALYRPRLTAARYRAWLRSVGVRFVVLAHAVPASESVDEAHLLASGASGLVEGLHESSTRQHLRAAPDATADPDRAGTRAGDHLREQQLRASMAGCRGPATTCCASTSRCCGGCCADRSASAPAPGDMTRLDVRRPGRFHAPRRRGRERAPRRHRHPGRGALLVCPISPARPGASRGSSDTPTRSRARARAGARAPRAGRASLACKPV